MQLELETLGRTRDFLKEKMTNGSRWVGYPGINRPLTAENLLCFHSASEASNWCQLPETEHGSGQMTQEIRHFKPITDILISIELKLTGQEPLNYPPEDIPEILQKYEVSPIFRHTYDSLCLQLSTGEIAVANHTRLLIPAEQIERYHLVSHHHQLHQNFQVGHSVRLIESFTHFSEGHRKFLELAPELTHDRAESIADLILVGQFRNSDLLLDIEGRPDINTGITIATAYEYMGVLKLEANANLHLPQTIDQRLFVKLDAGVKGLLFLNDNLEPANTITSFQSVHHFWFYDQPVKISSSRQVKQRYFYHDKGDNGLHVSR